MTTPQEERSESPSLLLMISDAAEFEASARSKHREVRRWSSSGASGAAGYPGQAMFTGDPADPATYGWIDEARAVTAIVHLKDDARATRVVEALRSVRPDSALLVLSEAVDHAEGDGTLARAGELRDVLRLDLEDELLRLEAERRAWCLGEFVKGAAVVPILVHPDPDPDALSSALALRVLLGRDAASSPLISAGVPTRPENLRMMELLQLEIETHRLKDLSRYERVIVVDTQPRDLGENGPRLAVIDHHPAETNYKAEFIDVRPEYGATATMMTEYLQARETALIDSTLATALLYGIRTDTDSLRRGVTPADVTAYAFLQTIMDPALLRRIEKPSIPLDSAHVFGAALRDVRIDDRVAYAFAGRLGAQEKHILPDIADYCMNLDGVDRAAAAAIIDDKLIVTLRDSSGDEEGVARIARALGELGGSGGGHAMMARAVIPLSHLSQWKDGNEIDALMKIVKTAQTRGA